MSLTSIVAAAKDGKVADFETAFNQLMAVKVLAKIDSIQADIGADVPIEGEIEVEPAGDKDGGE